MIKKIELIELIEHRLGGEAQTKNLGKIHRNLLAYYIGRAFNSLLIEVFRKNLSNFDAYTKWYEDVDIKYDSTTGIYYSILPAPVIQLPRTGDGILQISDMFDQTIQYTPITNGELQNIVGLDIDTIDSVVGYTFKNGRVEYQGTDYDASQSTYSDIVRMLLVIPFEEYAETDYVQIPTGSDELLLQTVVNLLIRIPDADNLNNNNTFNPNTQR